MPIYEVNIVLETKVRIKAKSKKAADTTAWVWAQRVCDVGNIAFEGSDEEVTALETRPHDVEMLGKVTDDAH
jgi:hypothetical protein